VVERGWREKNGEVKRRWRGSGGQATKEKMGATEEKRKLNKNIERRQLVGGWAKKAEWGDRLAGLGWVGLVVCWFVSQRVVRRLEQAIYLKNPSSSLARDHSIHLQRA
jgi:hypothetical protein